MPAPLKGVDWNLAQVLYSQGLRFDDISSKIGVKASTLRKRAVRHGWATVRTAALTAVAQTGVETGGRTLAARSERVRDCLAEDLERAASLLAAQPPSTVRELANTPAGQGRAAVAKTIADTAASVFDWRDSSQQGLVIVGAISAMGEAEEPAETSSATVIQDRQCSLFDSPADDPR
jgi:hypothetical protein